jgi:hypothetical protein
MAVGGTGAVRMLPIAVLITAMTAGAVLPARAQAAAGWILWEKNMINKPASPPLVTWEPLDGYERIVECRRSGQDLLRAAPSISAIFVSPAPSIHGRALRQSPHLNRNP